MARFLKFRDVDGITGYVQVEDIASLVADEKSTDVEPLTTIALRSDVKYTITAQGWPHEVLLGTIFEL